MSNELIIPPLGFMNTASICYFNSLIQSLLSCSSFLSFICKDQQDSIFYLFFKFIVFEQKWDPYFTTKLLHSMNTFEPNQSSSEYFLKLCDFFKMDDLLTLPMKERGVEKYAHSASSLDGPGGRESGQ